MKEVSIAVFGSASGLAGLVLVFLGVVIAAYRAYPGDTPEVVKAPLRLAGTWTFALFVMSLVTAFLAFLWLVAGGGTALYLVAVAAFVVLLVAILVAAARISRELLDGFRWR